MPDVEIVDRDDPNAIRYPTIKNEGENGAIEHRITLPVRDIIVPGLSETVYFPLDFCMKDLVIDAVAQKYHADIDDYPLDSDDEHFLIGTQACRKESKKLACLYMKKTLVRINAAANLDVSDLFAIYLLSLDDSNENRQKFLLMTKTKLYLLHDTQAIETYGYNDIRFTPDGLELKRLGESVGQRLLEYTFDERFLNFAHEFMLLRRTTLVDVRERHPFANVIDDKKSPDVVADMSLNVDEVDGRPSIRKRNAYMKFLVDTAAAEGHLQAKTILKLCYMAREFRISGDAMLSWLNHSICGGIRKNKLLAEFARTLTFIGAKYKFVFVQDLLEVGTDDDGNFHRQELLKIFKRPQFGVEKFVAEYLPFVGQRNRAMRQLQTAFQNIDDHEICFKHSIREQSYINGLTLQLAMMGAMLNEQ